MGKAVLLPCKCQDNGAVRYPGRSIPTITIPVAQRTIRGGTRAEVVLPFNSLVQSFNPGWQLSPSNLLMELSR